MKSCKFYIVFLFLIALFKFGEAQETVVTLDSDMSGSSYDTTAQYAVFLEPGFKYTAIGQESFWAHILPDTSLPTISSIEYIDPGSISSEINTTLPVGSIQGAANVLTTGAASYFIPIDVPPAAKGLQPSLSLVYNSYAGNGIMGMGWELAGISKITRVPKNTYYDGVIDEVKLDASDNFAIDGMRMVLTDGSLGQANSVYHTKVDNYHKITAQESAGNGPKWFKVETKDGLTMEYGNAPKSFLEELRSRDNNTIYSWFLNKIYDQFGNYMEFKWEYVYHLHLPRLPDLEIYLSSIEYGGNTKKGNDCYNKINFRYAEREDIFNEYIEGVVTKEHSLLLKNITIESNGNLKSEYSLNYIYDGASKLASVGLKGSKGKVLNNTIFNWGTETSSGIISPYQLRTSFPEEYFDDIIFDDFSGDNKVDVIYKNSVNNTWNLYIYDDHYEPKYDAIFVNSPLDNVLQVFSGDINNDGKNSIFLVKDASGSDKLLEYTADISYSWTPTAEYSGSIELIKSTDLPTTNCKTVRFGDFDGDGVQDIIAFDANNNVQGIILGESGINVTLTHVNNPKRVELVDANGNGKTDVMVTDNYNASEIYELVSGNSFSETGKHIFPGSDTNWFTGEFDGDARTDVLYFEDGEWKISRSGATTGYSAEGGLPLRKRNLSSTFFITVADINNDGYDDIFELYYQSINDNWTPKQYDEKCSIHYNNGNGTFATVNMDDKFFGIIPPNLERRLIFTDLNGDLMKDYVYFLKEPNIEMSGYNFPISPYFHNNLVTEIRNGIGIKSEFNYSRPIAKNDSDPDVFVENLYRPPIYLVDNFKEESGSLIARNQNYVFNTPFIHKQGLGFLGFGEMIVDDNVAKIKQKDIYSIDHQMFNGCIQFLAQTSSETPNLISVLYQALLQESVILDVNNDTIVKTIYEYNVDITDPCDYLDYELFYVNPDKKIEKNYRTALTTTTDYGFDDYGNLTYSKVNYNGDATVQMNNIYTGFGTWYCPKSRLQKSTITQTRGGDSYSHSTWYDYNSNGALTTQKGFYNQPKEVTQSYTEFDDFGNPQTITISANGLDSRKTLLEYNDGYGRFITKRTNPLGHFEEFTYDGKTGNILTHTDANQLVTTNVYDGFGRLEKATYPDLNTTNITRQFEVDGEQLYWVQEETGGQPLQKKWYDRLGRVIKTEEAGFSNSIYTDIQYNPKGELWKVSEPYTTSGDLHTVHDYYGDGRIKTINYPGGITENYTYSGTQTSVTSNNGMNKATETDGTGALISSTDNGGTINYTYYPHGGVKDISFGGNTISMTYDEYGRQESLTDPDAGTITYLYNAYGELEQQIDNRGNTYNMEYDSLGRLDVKMLGTIVVADYTYDNAPGKGIGQLAKIEGDNGITYTYEYDNLSLLSKKTENIQGEIFEIETTYDEHSQIHTISYPQSGYTIENNYQNGYISIVNGTYNGGATTNIFTASGYNQRGQIETYSMGNGLSTTRTYNAATGFPASISTPTVQNFGYNFDDLTGNLNYRQEADKNLKETFSYDNLMKSRLNIWQVNTLTPDTVNYAHNGNIDQKSGLGSFAYNPLDPSVRPHAVTDIENTDGLISETEQKISYTAFNKVDTITEGDYRLEITYGPDNQRKKTELYKKTGSKWKLEKTKYFIGGSYEVEITGNQQQYKRHLNYIYGGDGLAAIFEDDNGTPSLYYIYKDHLGSITSVTDEAGAVVQQMNFDPWGRRRNASNWTFNDVPTEFIFDRGFTGHEHLDEFNLINMNGRVYDPVLGRFLSPDNYLQLPDFTQNLNRYTYALNNPLSYTDPSGNSFLGSLFRAWFGNYVIGGMDRWINKDMSFNDAFFNKKYLTANIGVSFSPGNMEQQYNYGFSHPQVDAYNLVQSELEFERDYDRWKSTLRDRPYISETALNNLLSENAAGLSKMELIYGNSIDVALATPAGGYGIEGGWYLSGDGQQGSEFYTHGPAYGLEASVGWNMIIIKPKDNFKFSDLKGMGASWSVNISIFSLSKFGNSSNAYPENTKYDSYVGYRIGIGAGLGASISPESYTKFYKWIPDFSQKQYWWGYR